MARDVLEELVTKFTYDVDQAGLNKYLRSQEKINRNTKNMIGLNTTLSKVMRRLFIGAGAIMGFNSMFQTYRNFDMVQRSLNALTGSAEEGAEHFEFLKRAAFQTGTGIMEVAKAYRGYYYAAKTAGLTNEELQHSFLGVMVGARVLGANKQQVGGAMLALEQMLNKTTVQAQEMNLQLGNAISGAKEMAAEAMGMSVPEFVEKMQKKMINSAEFVRKFGDYMYKTFIDRLPEAMKSLDASVVNLQNAWLIFQHEIMKGGLGDELTKLTGQLMQLLLSPEAKSFAHTIGAGLNMVGKALSFIVKHFRAILLLWGINALIQIPIAINAMKWKIIDLATATRTNLTPMMEAVVAILAQMIQGTVTLSAGLKTMGAILKANIANSLKALIGFLFTPQGLILSLVAVALAGIALSVKDIYMYMKDPEALTVTRQLVKKHSELGETFEAFRKNVSAFKDMWKRDVAPELEKTLSYLSNWLKGEHPALKAFFVFIIESIGAILRLINAAIDGMNALKGNKGKREQERARWQLNAGLVGGIVGGLAGLPFGGVGGFAGMGIGTTSGGVIGGHLYDLFHPETVGGYNLNKTQSQNITYNNNISINASQFTPYQVESIVAQAVDGTMYARSIV